MSRAPPAGIVAQQTARSRVGLLTLTLTLALALTPSQPRALFHSASLRSRYAHATLRSNDEKSDFKSYTSTANFVLKAHTPQGGGLPGRAGL